MKNIENQIKNLLSFNYIMVILDNRRSSVNYDYITEKYKRYIGNIKDMNIILDYCEDIKYQKWYNLILHYEKYFGVDSFKEICDDPINCSGIHELLKQEIFRYISNMKECRKYKIMKLLSYSLKSNENNK